ncbi:MAG: hypothetical protein IKK58_03975 [Clostridia bacterium]|nr:hypothetical protein [Clostridia bacterium]
MSYDGKWVFHSMGVMNEDFEMVYLNAEDYISSPMPYVDETDPEAVADELKERRQGVATCIEVCGSEFYMMVPLPEGVSQKEVDEAVAAGHIKLRNGMMYDKVMNCDERDGELWLEVGEGMSEDGWVKLSNGEYLDFMTMRFVKE